MNMSNQEYDRLAKKASPPSPFIKNFLMAFLVGGLICTIGEVILLSAQQAGADKDTAAAVCSVSLVLLSVILTGLDVYDSIAKFAGAGTLVPITGFANSIASAAVEFKSEGWILGLGAKMFTIAGPVIVYGISASVVYGVILWVIGLF